MLSREQATPVDFRKLETAKETRGSVEGIRIKAAPMNSAMVVEGTRTRSEGDSILLAVDLVLTEGEDETRSGNLDVFVPVSADVNSIRWDDGKKEALWTRGGK
jgi:hypothetical protein